jgi:hypothetical protein
MPLLVVLLGAGEPTTREAKVGSFTLTFKARSPLTSAEQIADRMGIGVEPLLRATRERTYGLAAESFDVYVPASYTGQEPFGLFVWVSPGDTVGMAPGWKEALDKHKLIWIGANKAGNDRAPWIRIGLGLDAAHNIKKLYSIDEGRVYAAGLSGGGRISSMLAVGFPDVFSGGFYMCGVSYYRRVQSAEQGGAFFRPEFLMPPAKVLADAKKRRHVLLTGTNDLNREQTRVYSEQYKRDGFASVAYLEVPGMDHQPPDAEWFEKGLAILDGAGGSGSTGTTRPAAKAEKAAARPAPAAASNEKAATELKAARELVAKDVVAGCEAMMEVARKYPSAKEAVEATLETEKLMGEPKVKKAVEARQEADKLVRVAKIYVDNRMYDEARNRLKKVLDEYSQTPSAKPAREMLEQIKGK